MFLIYKKIQVSFVLLIVFVISSCGESSPYPILDSGAGAEAQGREPIEWLDNHRVIYKGYSGPKPPPNEEGGWSPVDWGLFIWDTRTNETKRYADGGKVCYHDGYIYYQVKGRKPVTGEFPHRSAWMEGAFGKETYHQIKYRRGEKPDRSIRRSQINCHLQPVPEEAKGSTALLLEEGEYIDRSGTHNGENSYVFHTKKKDIHVGLPIPARTFYVEKYYPFSDRYLLYSYAIQESCKQGGCMPVWWVDREGNTEKILLHLDKNKAAWDLIVPVKAGYFLIQHAPQPLGGGYLVGGDNQTQLVLKGHIKNPAVSPDGCKAAFTHFRTIEDLVAGTQHRPTLKMIDFCDSK